MTKRRPDSVLMSPSQPPSSVYASDRRYPIDMGQDRGEDWDRLVLRLLDGIDLIGA